MVHLKILIVLIMSTMGLISRSHSSIDLNERIVFYSGGDTVTLVKNEYKTIIREDSTGFELKILSANKLNSIKTLIDPTVQFTIYQKRLTGRGIDILSSTVPPEVDYFFALNKEKRVIMWKGNIIDFLNIERLTRNSTKK